MRRAISEGRAVERPQIAHATSSHGLANAAASVRIGVAKSTKTDTAEATEAALRQLASKLGGATPDVVLVVLCGANPHEPSPYDLDACLARLRVGEHALGASTKVVATTSCMGIAVESQWVGGNAIALMGICDPEGAYEVCYADASQGSEAVRERVAAAAARSGRDGPPAVSIVFTQGNETTSLRGIQAALGEEAHLVGGCIFLANPPGLAVSPGGGEPDEQGVRRRLLLCWPTATVVSFVSSRFYPPGATDWSGSSRRRPPRRRDHGPGERGGVVKTIDGRPASKSGYPGSPRRRSAASIRRP